jgi:hypothetical protein
VGLIESDNSQQSRPVRPCNGGFDDLGRRRQRNWDANRVHVRSDANHAERSGRRRVNRRQGKSAKQDRLTRRIENPIPSRREWAPNLRGHGSMRVQRCRREQNEHEPHAISLAMPSTAQVLIPIADLQ